jgi:transposase
MANLFYKYEIAEKIGVSKTTLRNWLNIKYFSELQKLGYEKRQKYLTTKQINYLREILCFDV